MIGTIRTALPVLLAAGALIGATDASAAQRFATPGGLNSGTCATPATACALERAVSSAAGLADGDEVVLASGTYANADVGLGLLVQKSVTIRGQDGAPPPTLRFTGGGPGATVQTGAAVTLRRLRIERSGSVAPAVLHTRQDLGLTLDETTVAATGTATAAVGSSGPLTVRNSLVTLETTSVLTAIGIDVSSLAAASVRIVNSTIRSSGPLTQTVSLRCLFFPVTLTATIVNSVLAGGTDLTASGLTTGKVAITARNSSIRGIALNGDATFTDGGGNQNSDPQLSAEGVPLAGSPLIDAGVAEPDIGATDLAGNARNQGPAPDIGAFEAPGLVLPGSGAGPAPPPADPPPTGGAAGSSPGAGGQAGPPTATPLVRLRLLKLPSTVRRATLRKRLTVNVEVTGPATVVAELTGPRRKRLARTRVTARKAGKVTLRLKARVAGRKRVPATLKVTATPAGGKPATVSRKLTIR